MSIIFVVAATVAVSSLPDANQEEKTGATFFGLLRLVVSQLNNIPTLTPILQDMGNIEQKYDTIILLVLPSTLSNAIAVFPSRFDHF
jgi:hypothetical protein